MSTRTHVWRMVRCILTSSHGSDNVTCAGSWAVLSHCSYHQHSERFLLAVTAGPPQKEILVWDRWSGHMHTVGLYSPRKDRLAFLHDDMHPAWSADACTLAFDSTHTGQGWQVCRAVCYYMHVFTGLQPALGNFMMYLHCCDQCSVQLMTVFVMYALCLKISLHASTRCMAVPL